MNPVLHNPDAIAAGLIRDAQIAALTEARAVLADVIHHEDDRLAEAARTVLRLTRCDAEYALAFRILQTLDRLELIP